MLTRPYIILKRDSAKHETEIHWVEHIYVRYLNWQTELNMFAPENTFLLRTYVTNVFIIYQLTTDNNKNYKASIIVRYYIKHHP